MLKSEKKPKATNFPIWLRKQTHQLKTSSSASSECLPIIQYKYLITSLMCCFCTIVSLDNPGAERIGGASEAATPGGRWKSGSVAPRRRLSLSPSQSSHVQIPLLWAVHPAHTARKVSLGTGALVTQVFAAYPAPFLVVSHLSKLLPGPEERNCCSPKAKQNLCHPCRQSLEPGPHQLESPSEPPRILPVT